MKKKIKNEYKQVLLKFYKLYNQEQKVKKLYYYNIYLKKNRVRRRKKVQLRIKPFRPLVKSYLE